CSQPHGDHHAAEPQRPAHRATQWIGLRSVRSIRPACVSYLVHDHRPRSDQTYERRFSRGSLISGLEPKVFFLRASSDRLQHCVLELSPTLPRSAGWSARTCAYAARIVRQGSVLVCKLLCMVLRRRAVPFCSRVNAASEWHTS